MSMPDRFSLAGKRWEDLRQATNRAIKEKLTFELVYPPFDTALLTDLERVSDAWLAEKGGGEKGFSLGRFDAGYFAWSPLGLVRRDGDLIAFANVLLPYALDAQLRRTRPRPFRHSLGLLQHPGVP